MSVTANFKALILHIISSLIALFLSQQSWFEQQFSLVIKFAVLYPNWAFIPILFKIGNIKINKEVLNVKELLNQVTGEFEDKFNSRGLNIISKLPEKTVYIKADSRYLYRVLENIYSNVAKYAEENTRVYIDCILEEENTVAIYVKNISKDKLNISAEELMQRFVRGDKSRNTEGSGLGLSIAKSLTELQDGTFNIYLDGDLFKVAIKFKRV